MKMIVKNIEANFCVKSGHYFKPNFLKH